MEGLQKNIPDLEYPCIIWLLTKAAEISRGPSIGVPKYAPGFMLQIDFTFLNVEIIREFTSTFVAICYSNSYQFRFLYRINVRLLIS